MTKDQLLDLITATFRRTCGGLPKSWDNIVQAVNDFHYAAHEEGWADGYEAAQYEDAKGHRPT